jgi:hypothetical protein
MTKGERPVALIVALELEARAFWCEISRRQPRLNLRGFPDCDDTRGPKAEQKNCVAYCTAPEAMISRPGGASLCVALASPASNTLER